MAVVLLSWVAFQGGEGAILAQMMSKAETAIETGETLYASVKAPPIRHLHMLREKHLEFMILGRIGPNFDQGEKKC